MAAQRFEFPRCAIRMEVGCSEVGHHGTPEQAGQTMAAHHMNLNPLMAALHTIVVRIDSFTKVKAAIEEMFDS